MTGPASDEPHGRWAALWLLAIALVSGMSTWFSASAVIPQLDVVWDLDGTTKAWLTIAVQIGFVVGALVSASLSLADVVPARTVIATSAIAASIANLVIVAVDTPWPAIALRFLTGFFIAGVYPPAFKLISTWHRTSRGFALGVLGGAIVLGNATPHLVNAVGGVEWQRVIVATSVLSALGGLAALAVRDGPFEFPRAVFDPRQVRLVLANRGVRLATIGYVGHMWELFAMYAWILVFLTDHLAADGRPDRSTAAFLTFVTVALGGVGSFVAGRLSDRTLGRTGTARLSLWISGTCAATVGLLFDAPTPIVVAVVFVWGLAIVADSAQFSAMVTELADQSYVGTALTVQTALGFTITVATIWLIPIVEAAISWRWAFMILVIGPAIGIWAMNRLRSLPEAARLTGGRA